MAERQNLEISRRSSKAYTVKFFKEGSVQDITGWTVYMTIKANMDDLDANAKLKKKITEHLNAQEGIAIIELTSDDTNITAGNYYYSIDYKDTNDNEDIVISGIMKIKEPTLKTRD
jgi:hypothetical protein